MAQKIQIRGDDAAAWTAANPILAEREIGLETDTNQMKVGNGTDTWSSLPYIEIERVLERVDVSVTAGVLTLDMAGKHEKKFEVSAAQSSAFAIAFSNMTEAEFFSLVVPITGTVAITLPSNVVSRRADTRWNNSTKILTVTALASGDLFELSFDAIGGPKYILRASDPNYSS